MRVFTCVEKTPSQIFKRVLDLTLLKHDFLITTVEGYFYKWLFNKIIWVLPSNKNYIFTTIVRMHETSQVVLFVMIVYS